MCLQFDLIFVSFVGLIDMAFFNLPFVNDSVCRSFALKGVMRLLNPLCIICLPCPITWVVLGVAIVRLILYFACSTPEWTYGLVSSTQNDR